MFSKRNYRLVLCCSALSVISLFARAGLPKDNDAATIYTGTQLSAGAVFLRPGGSNDYAVLVNPFNANVAAPILSPSWQPEGISADFSPGFTVNLTHVFAGTNTDWSLNWTHLKTSDSASFPVNRNPPPAQQMTGPFWNIGPDAGTTSAASGRVRYDYDVFNAEVGQRISLKKFQGRVFAGLSGLWVEQEMAANFSGTDPILGVYTFGITTQSTYHAGGVRVGLEGNYPAFLGVQLVGSVAGGLYLGSQQPNTTTVGTGRILSNAGIATNHQSINHHSYLQAIPAVDTKLGLSYSRRYSAESVLTIEAGYRASVYSDVIQNYVPSTYVPGSLGIVSGSVFLQSLIKTTDNLSLDGPYVTAAITF